MEVGAATTVDWPALTPPAVTVTVAVCVITTALIVAETVFPSATVELNVPAATPLAFVNPGCVTVLPEPEAASTTVAPSIGLPLASRAVTVILEVSLPAVIDVGDATTVDWPALTPPAVTVTVAVWVIATKFTVAETVFPSATVELNVPVATPLAFVNPGCVTVLPEPEAASTTVAPSIGLPLASRAVTVILEVSLPAVIDVGDATTVDWPALTPPAVTVTVAVWVIATKFTVAETVFPSATVELNVPVATPLAFVNPGCVTVLPEPEAASTTVAPWIGLPLASLAVTVIVEGSVPAVMEVGAATTVDWPALTPPAVTVTVAVCVITTALIVAETVFPSATVELNVPAATPLAFVNPGCVTVLPEPEAASTTVAPWIGLPLASFAVTVIVEGSVPAVMEVGAATTVDWPALTLPAVTVTVAVCVITTALIVAETVLLSATVELNVPAATPLAFVGPAG